MKIVWLRKDQSTGRRNHHFFQSGVKRFAAGGMFCSLTLLLREPLQPAKLGVSLHDASSTAPRHIVEMVGCWLMDCSSGSLLSPVLILCHLVFLHILKGILPQSWGTALTPPGSWGYVTLSPSLFPTSPCLREGLLRASCSCQVVPGSRGENYLRLAGGSLRCVGKRLPHGAGRGSQEAPGVSGTSQACPWVFLLSVWRWCRSPLQLQRKLLAGDKVAEDPDQIRLRVWRSALTAQGSLSASE